MPKRSALPCLVAVAKRLTACALAILLYSQAMAQESGKAVDAKPPHKAEELTFLGYGASVTLGAGSFVAPVYQGANTFKVTPFPYVDVKIFEGRVFLSTVKGLGVNIVDLGPLQAGASVNYGGARYSSESHKLKGLTTLGDEVIVSGFMTYKLEPFTFELKAKNFFGQNPGTEALLGMSYTCTPISGLRLSMGPQITWADSRYNKAYFGVTQREAFRATVQGNPMHAYTPGAGIKDVGLSITGNYQLTEHWGVMARIGISDLVGSQAKDSPLVQNTLQPSAGASVMYKF